MVVLNKIYTRTGDSGTTALGSGERRPKHDLRIEAYGTVDETNASVGLVRLWCESNSKIDVLLATIQNDLFDLGADLASPDTGKKLKYEPLRIVESQIKAIEMAIDEFNESLEPLKSFVLPGGNKVATQLHMARTVCRRAERQITKLSEQEKVNPEVIRYMNRLSDLLFVLSRWVNNRENGDVLWIPGKNR